MKFVRLRNSTYERFAEGAERMAIPQIPEYVATRRAQGYQVELVGVVDDDQLVAAAAVLMQPWRKIFKKANLVFGPTFAHYSPQAEETFYRGLVSWLKSTPRVIALRLAPMVVRAHYEDVERGPETEHAERLDQLIAELGGELLDKDFRDSSDIQTRFVYIKDLEGMDLAQVTKSVAQQVRTAFNRWGTNGVEVRFNEPGEIGVLENVLTHTAERTDTDAPTQSEISYYQDLAERLGPDRAFFPVAVLRPAEYLEKIAEERQEIEAKVAGFAERERALEAEGKALGRKQRNQLKELQGRLEVLERREKETAKVHAEHGDEVVLAASFFIQTPNELTYLVSGAYSQFNDYYGIYLIHRAMLDWATRNGVRWYNFFGMTGDFSEDASDAGVVHFKRQFKGDTEEYVGTYEVPIRPMLAKVAGAVD
ncbi:lipid II:glycine glycyltransferase (peptidoglycan interpeptide bridge formation enzyme) [Trueperella bonasi]|uniref:Lipid II:glycine glycyltransferase (Peptidoglycan interpeptide bridge formation enzyme) n=1 Tax=Trueperella bonasi TaxID=312286 RepID=A0ABT9NHF2_9ACTO|nr:peptidoglycan bridge formation glycyltransferase FemA/FemB family protein [Trueperella bonasi]MDP9806800.1 lipid II:glycine glycyltransferase (peptidoglycan interpeptide bridge formation enzyme) [Trueperella bonasi]